MKKILEIGIIHYSCPPVVGGVEEVISQHASTLHRMGQSVSILAGMGEVFTRAFPVRIEPLLGSKHPNVSRSHDDCRKGDQNLLNQLTEKIFNILIEWSSNLDVVIAHNVLQMPFNLPLTIALRRLAGSNEGPVIVSWAHDSPYFQPDIPRFLNRDPWTILRTPHADIHYVTISESRKELFRKHGTEVEWAVIPNGVDPVNFFYLDQKSMRLAQELDFFSRDLIVVQPSRITPRKNLELSIHIVRSIKTAGYNILFVLTGAYDPHAPRALAYYRRLKYWIEELGLKKHIAILAEYRFKDGTRLIPDRIFIRDLYLLADLLLMTSKDEGFGLPVLEAGMIKLPVACSNIPPFIELGEDVCFFNVDDPPMLTAGRILEYLARTNTHKMFRKAMTKYVLDEVCKNQIIPYLYNIAG
jgi:glycosyltransferase involved in cell wall biosynthesis